MCAAAQTANRGQEGGGAGHAGRGRNAARWLSSLRALLLCWLPAALLHWRHAQRALASELSSGMPDDHDTALHSTRVQPIRPINLARAGADGPEPRRQVHLHCAFEAFPQSSFGFRDNSYVVCVCAALACRERRKVRRVHRAQVFLLKFYVYFLTCLLIPDVTEST